MRIDSEYDEELKKSETERRMYNQGRENGDNGIPPDPDEDK